MYIMERNIVYSNELNVFSDISYGAQSGMIVSANVFKINPYLSVHQNLDCFREDISRYLPPFEDYFKNYNTARLERRVYGYVRDHRLKEMNFQG